MGTSVSQPSHGSGQGSKEWTNFQGNVSSGKITPDKVLSGVKEAFKGEYGSEYINTIVDKGVSLIENFIENFTSSENIPAEAAFIIKGRKLLSQHQSNSFLAELALTKAASCASIDNIRERKTAFYTNYLTGVIDYSISRDLTKILGHTGISNISKLENYINDVKNEISKIAIKKKTLKEILND